MSAWPIPDEVVRELARFVVVECLGATEECVVPSDFDRARAFLTRHRLVQMDEPEGWTRWDWWRSVRPYGVRIDVTREQSDPTDVPTGARCAAP